MGLDNSYKPGAYFEYKTVIIPADTKVDRGGEDAADGTDTMLIVADGVGGWSLSGVDPGFFSRKLVSSGIEHHLKSPTSGPLEVLTVGCDTSSASFQGSATVVGAKIASSEMIETGNLGDSGYMLFHLSEDGTRLENYFVSETM